jgi:hypothetical protein
MNDQAEEPGSDDKWIRIPRPRWLAQMDCHDWFLQELSLHFVGSVAAVGRIEKGTWWLASEQFETVATASEVHDIAQELTSVILAIARVRIGTGPDIKLTGLFMEKIDETHARPHWIKAGEFTVWRVSRVLAFLAAPRSWQSLFAAFEIVLNDPRIGATRGVVQKKWATRSEIDRVTGTSNNFGAAGV